MTTLFQPNYIATIYGDIAGIADDEFYDIDGINLVDLLEAKGVSWKGYFQQYRKLLLLLLLLLLHV